MSEQISSKLVTYAAFLVTLGIKATRPDTGYGYIQYDDINSLENNINIKKVKTFTEKPNRDLALQFLDSGDFLWNAGIFAFSSIADTYVYDTDPLKSLDDLESVHNCDFVFISKTRLSSDELIILKCVCEKTMQIPTK